MDTENGQGSSGRAPAGRAAALRAAHRRAIGAKAGLATLGTLVFGTAMVFAQRSYAGHTKDPATALEAPPQFVRVVKQDLLQAGVVGPAQAPPGAATAPS
ncbi:MAG: hypothetical protein ABJB55_07400 [Actinomycetota bacterium]